MLIYRASSYLFIDFDQHARRTLWRRSGTLWGRICISKRRLITHRPLSSAMENSRRRKFELKVRPEVTAYGGYARSRLFVLRFNDASNSARTGASRRVATSKYTSACAFQVQRTRAITRRGMVSFILCKIYNILKSLYARSIAMPRINSCHWYKIGWDALYPLSKSGWLSGLKEFSRLSNVSNKSKSDALKKKSV